jgi:hypothetical protein
MQTGILRPGLNICPVFWIHDRGIKGVLKEYRVELLFDGVVEELAVVPLFKTEAIRVETEFPTLRGRKNGSSCKSE